MNKMSKLIEIKINMFMPHYEVGQVIRVATDDDGTPLDVFWRRRLKDAKIDGCCEVVQPATKTKVSRKKVTNRPLKIADETNRSE